MQPGRALPDGAARLMRGKCPVAANCDRCDVLGERPRILFVGINPSLTSGRVGHHFAGPGNPFWRLLHAAGIVPEPLTYEQDARLAEFGLAFTKLCPRAPRSAAELTPRDIERGRRALTRKCALLEPRVIAFVGL